MMRPQDMSLKTAAQTRNLTKGALTSIGTTNSAVRYDVVLSDRVPPSQDNTEIETLPNSVTDPMSTRVQQSNRLNRGSLHIIHPGEVPVTMKTLNLNNVVGATLSHRGNSGRRKNRRNVTAQHFNRTIQPQVTENGS